MATAPFHPMNGQFQLMFWGHEDEKADHFLVQLKGHLDLHGVKSEQLFATLTQCFKGGALDWLQGIGPNGVKDYETFEAAFRGR